MISLQNGLSDLSRELGETTVNQTSSRIGHYNDAIIEFAGEKKFPFLVKTNEDLTVSAGVLAYTIPSAVLADWRTPGAIKAIYVGTAEFKPIDWEDRNDDSYSGKKYFYIDPEETTITFMIDLGTAGVTISILYYYLPSRTTDTTSGTFPIPDRYRKVIAVLGAAFVQFSRYLDAQGKLKLNLYERMMGKVNYQQSERHRFKDRKLQHYLQWRKFRRTYPN